MAIVEWALRRFAVPLRIAALKGPCLIIAPHPDDELLGCGATVMRACEAGRRVCVVVVTDGRASHKSDVMTPEQLAAIRRKESERACALLGVAPDDIVFLPFVDRTARHHVRQIEAELAAVIRAFRPSQIFSPSSLDRHKDHRAVAAAIDNLCRRGMINVPVYEYLVWFPSWVVFATRLLRAGRWRTVSTSGLIDRKKAALRAYESQTVNLTSEARWWAMNDKFIAKFFTSYEVFFERRRPDAASERFERRVLDVASYS